MNKSPAHPPTPPRPKRWRKVLAWLPGVLLLLAGAVYVTRDFWLTTLRAYAIGRVYLAGEEYGRDLPEVDEVEILALGGEVPAGTPDSFQPGLAPRRGTVNRRNLHGGDATRLASLWRNQDFNQYYGALCHDPFYALRFRRRGKLVLETSICWKCRNVILPVGSFGETTEYGFNARDKQGQLLLTTLTDYAPHPAAKP